MDSGCGMIVQLPLSPPWGTDGEWDVRGQIREALENLFASHDYGQFDGADFGSGTTNFFIYHVPESKWDKAVELVLAELRRFGYADEVVIARSVLVEQDGEELPEHTVVWPKDYPREFSLF